MQYILSIALKDNFLDSLVEPYVWSRSTHPCLTIWQSILAAWYYDQLSVCFSSLFFSGGLLQLTGACPAQKGTPGTCVWSYWSIVMKINVNALGAMAKVHRTPAKRTQLVSLETPSLPTKRTKGRTSGFNSQTNVHTKDHLKHHECFLRDPLLPKRSLFVSLGFCELLRWPVNSTIATRSLLFWALLSGTVVIPSFIYVTRCHVFTMIELLLFFEKCFLAHTLVLRHFRDFVLFFFHTFWKHRTVFFGSD